MLAGLPELEDAIDQAITHSDRLFEYRELGNLDRDATREALLEPAAVHGVRWIDDAVEFVIDLSQGYPSFVQEYGFAIWEALGGRTEIDLDLARAGAEQARLNVARQYRSVWRSVTPAGRDYLAALAVLGGEARTAEVAEAMSSEAERADDDVEDVEGPRRGPGTPAGDGRLLPTRDGRLGARRAGRLTAPWCTWWSRHPSDPRLADYVRLRETSLRRSLESEHGLFIAEGEKVIRRAVEAGYAPRSFLLAERWLPGLADVLARWPDVPVYVVSRGPGRTGDRIPCPPGCPRLAASRRAAHASPTCSTSIGWSCLEDVVDHTNVGAIIRCAAGLGWDGVLLAPRTADPLYRRSIKVSMGAVFSLPWARLADWASAPDRLRAAGLQTVALTLADDAVDLAAFAGDVAARPRRLAIMLGTEGAGLSARWTRAADVRVKIAMHAGIDSLNVAAAAAVACYALG